MTSPARWARIKQIFESIVDEPDQARRGAMLDEACAGDDDLRSEIESLLEHAQTADAAGPLQTGSAGRLLGSPAMAALRLGPYELLRELGRGGMGAVYLARRVDGQFHQEVAVKVIAQPLAGEELTRRFRTERQILASLNHPHIARLLDGGVGDHGEPYLAMEYVDGEPLLAFAARRALGLRARLDLFGKICDAVSYAHGKLVVHRDIKPSNVLVTAEGEPKLLDFGLAKMVDASAAGADTLKTVTAFRAFTPAYASPEQIRGDALTTASDVYTLGVVLYEFLTGQRPFDVADRTVTDMLRVLETHIPTRPSSALAGRRAAEPPRDADAAIPYRSSDLEHDLDTIVLKAIRREPEERYASVAAFADDVRRYLAGLPISARPHTLGYRAAKFVTRHAAAVAGVAITMIAVLGGLGASLWQASVAREQRDRATRRFEDVRRLSNSLLFELSPKIERIAGATDARDVLLRRALQYLDSLATESADDQQLQSELATAYEKIGDLQGNPTNPNLIDLDAAIESYSKARVIRARVATQAAPPADAARALAENYRVLGTIFSQANDFDRAAADLSVALRSYERLASAAPSDRTLQMALAQTTHDLGRSHSNSSRYAGALAPFERAIARAESLRRDAPGDVDAQLLLADTRAQYGLALSWEGRQIEAEAQMKDAAGIAESLTATRPDDLAVHSQLWSIYWLTSIVYEEQDDALSHAFARKALDVVQRQAEQDPSNLRAQQQLAKSYSRLGQTATNTGKAADAIRYLTEGSLILSRIVAGEVRNGRLRSELALVLTRLADARLAQRQLDGALNDARRSEAIYAELLRAYPSDRRSMRNLVLAHQVVGDIQERQARAAPPAQAERHRRDAIASYQQALDLMLRLQSGGQLAEADAKLLGELQQKVQRGPSKHEAARVAGSRAG